MEENLSVNLRADDAQVSLDNNIPVYPGDLIIVPRAGVVYVLGDVGRPGGLVMQDNGKITLLQALAQAGGSNRTAKLNHTVLLHKKANGYVREEIPLARIQRGLAGDIQLLPNDVLFVPSSTVRNMMQNTQDIVASLSGASLYALIAR